MAEQEMYRACTQSEAEQSGGWLFKTVIFFVITGLVAIVFMHFAGGWELIDNAGGVNQFFQNILYGER